MEVIIPILVQLVGGGVGGNVISAIIKKVNLGPAGNSIVGAIGGWLGTWLAGMIPGLDGIVKGVASTAATAGAGTGGVDFGSLLGQGATGIVGGGLLTAIAGLVKNSMNKG